MSKRTTNAVHTADTAPLTRRRRPNDGSGCELCTVSHPLTFHHLIPRKNHHKIWFGRPWASSRCALVAPGYAAAVMTSSTSISMSPRWADASICWKPCAPNLRSPSTSSGQHGSELPNEQARPTTSAFWNQPQGGALARHPAGAGRTWYRVGGWRAASQSWGSTDLSGSGGRSLDRFGSQHPGLPASRSSSVAAGHPSLGPSSWAAETVGAYPFRSDAALVDAEKTSHAAHFR